jgi:hypothetical protein
MDPKWSPNADIVSYVKGRDLFAYDLATMKEIQLTCNK